MEESGKEGSCYRCMRQARVYFTRVAGEQVRRSVWLKEETHRSVEEVVKDARLTVVSGAMC